MTDHLLQAPGVGLIGWPAVRSQADGSDAAGVDDAADADAPRGVDNIARAIDIAPIQRLRIRGPEPIVGGHVEQRLAAVERALERADIGQIAERQLGRHCLQIAAIGMLAHQRAYLPARRQQRTCDRRADEAAGAGDQRPHHPAPRASPARVG